MFKENQKIPGICTQHPDFSLPRGSFASNCNTSVKKSQQTTCAPLLRQKTQRFNHPKNGSSWLNKKAEISAENLVHSDELPPSLRSVQEPAGRDVFRWRQQLPLGAIHGRTGFCRACKNGWLRFEVIRGKILLPSQRALETVRLTHRQTDYFEDKDSFSAIVLRRYHCLWFQRKQCDIPGILFAGVCAHQLLCTGNSFFECLQFHLYCHCKSLSWLKAPHRVRLPARGTVKTLA